jgi:hypothetical protein
VRFSNGGPNRVVVKPTGVFIGSVFGSSSANNTLELAGGSGTLAAASGGAGTVTENGQSWSFSSFNAIAFDAGAQWTITGTSSIQTVLNNGTISAAGALAVTTEIDPASSGVFLLTDGSSLEVLAATGNASKIQFLGSSELIVDNAAAFGSNVGTPSASGPLLEGFAAIDTVDLKQFAATNLALNYNSSSGLLQISNGTQTADLAFQKSSLGAGTFQAKSDSANGVLVTHG